MPPMTLTLRRIRQTEHATFGELYDETGARIAVTLERPWKNDATDVSDIPTGTYRGRITKSPHLGYVTPELLNVPGRSGIRMHRGCLPRDSEGCILVGTAFGHVDYGDGTPDGRGDGITDSHAAFGRLMNLLADLEEFTLTITDEQMELAA